MKVDKKRFLDAIDYIKQVNKCNLTDLDLSEFFEDNKKFAFKKFTIINGEKQTIVKYKLLQEIIEDWGFTGLNNRDFILCYYEGE